MDEPGEPAGHRLPWRRWGREALREPLVWVLAPVGAGLLLVRLRHPEGGLFLVAAGLGLATLLRVVLPPQAAGLLVVRGRLPDVVALGALTVSLLVFALVVPFPADGG